MQIKLNPLHLPSESATLANGLRVVVQEDRSAPIVAVQIMYHVGSKNEKRGRTGLAHLLEHLLFEGSAHCPKGEFDRLLERAGGSNNGSTWFDRTNYYEVVPTHAVELALWLERERMGHFLPVLDEEMLEIQRSVVINERKQAYENRPYGLAYERLHELLFPQDHPYSWPTIGYTADLEATSLEDARSFYTRYYTPDNAVLVLVGDVGIDEAFGMADRYFGDLPQGGPHSFAEPVDLNGIPAAQRIEVLEDRVSFPRIHHGWAVPEYGSDDWIALDVLSYLLADGESSRLQRALIREHQIAQDVDTYLYPTEVVGVFGIVATARSGVAEDHLLAVIDDVVECVVSEGVERGEVTGAIRRARRDHLESLDNVEERADVLAYTTTVLGDADRVEPMLNRYAEITAEDIQRVASAYLRPDSRASVLVVPGAEGVGDA